MQRTAGLGALLSLGVLFCVSPARAEVLASSARQLPAGSLKLLTYYQGVQGQTVRFDVSGGACTTKNGVGFACDQAGQLDAEGSGGMGVVKLIYQPWDYLQYYGSIGVGDYTLSVPSSTVTTALTGDSLGLAGTIGVRATIYPDTIVTPALALDASLTGSRYDFNRRDPSGAPGLSDQINETLTLWQYQLAVETSHLFSVENLKVEPYGGMKWIRTRSDLHDRQDGTHAGGQLDTVTPFLGLKVPATDHEAFFAEASQFLDGYQYAGGLEVRFK